MGALGALGGFFLAVRMVTKFWPVCLDRALLGLGIMMMTYTILMPCLFGVVTKLWFFVLNIQFGFCLKVCGWL